MLNKKLGLCMGIITKSFLNFMANIGPLGILSLFRQKYIRGGWKGDKGYGSGGKIGERGKGKNGKGEEKGEN